eukprot:TRINITY_DN2913_c0_g1_i1.p1 TRINITY_DN2913_c0_g1~~TRINITY_DN2913_c0_g1_i1.p1  ORF type:complete len:416 (-),score=95.38 TRINITY_DN2913_c0_g1_i1:47-1294(-)
MTSVVEDLEKQPLLSKESEADSEEVEEELSENALEEPDDSMSYDARKLLTFDVLTALSGTVWTKASLWKMMGFLICVSMLVACTVALVVKHPGRLDTSKFAKISGFLSVIVGLLLGFFLSSSVARWYSCTKGFLELFDAIRGLQMQLSALGVPKARIDLCMRYCIVSANCLNIDLCCQTMQVDQRAEFKSKKWEKMLTKDKDSSQVYKKPNQSLAQIYQQEKEIMDTLDDPSQTLWVWVTSLITRMSADGEIPPMPTPTYGRTIALAEKAYNGIREVRASVCVQPPYVYVQMMAMLVNVNNLINAISFGMTLGVALIVIKQHGLKAGAKGLQDLLISFVLSLVGPFLYQALLEVAVCIAQPFAGASDAEEVSTAGRIPTDKLLFQLEKDIRDADFMSTNLPCWEQPRFKAPAAAK